MLSHDKTLAENRLRVKRYAAIPDFGQVSRVPRQRTKKAKPAKSVLQALFMKRVVEEMEARGLSGNALAKRVGGPAQKTLDDVLKGSDPRLKTVQEIATALGVTPWSLLRERDPAQRRGEAEEKPVIKEVNSGISSHFPLGKTGRKAKHKIAGKG